MLAQRSRVVCTILLRKLSIKAGTLPFNVALLTLALGFSLLVSCTTPPTQGTTSTPPAQKPAPTKTTTTPTTTASTPTPTGTAPPQAAPERYNARVLLSGMDRPDDMAFDNNGHLLFSDAHNGTVNRLNENGSVTVLVRGIAAPEGLVVLSDGTLLIAEQGPNRILSMAPDAPSPKVLRQLPGTPSTANCKDGVDGIAFDAKTNKIIVPDSPTGEVYSMSLDGKTLTLLTSGIVRPVGAAVDDVGNIYVADECGGALWRLTTTGQAVRIGNFGMLDDVALDANGNVLVTDLDPRIHALIRFNPVTGRRETLASKGYIEPQGLVIDRRGNIFLSDDFANIIVEYSPA